ncbi:MAG: GtrA family protein [Firmicutes bacterium]|nr:GtrA family protein [Bacillota bacterium]
MTRSPGSPPTLPPPGRLRAAFGPAGAVGELVRFSAVGVVTALLDLAVYNGALYLLGTRATPAVLVSSTLGFFASMLVSYLGNRHFTFRDRGGGQRFLPYAAVSLSGFFIENATLYLVWQVLIAAGVNHGYVAANLARAAAAVPALAWTFVLYRSVVFVPAAGARPAPRALRLPPAVHRLLHEHPVLPLAGLLALGVALRLPFLLSLPLGAEEWQTAHAAALLAAGRLGATPPSLLGVVLAGLFRLTGPSLSEPRVLAVLLSAAAVAATFFLGRALWRSALAGLLAALVVAANGPSVLASHVAVPGVAAPAAVAAAGWATVRALDGSRRLLALAGALWLVAWAAGPWAVAAVPGAALVLAGGLAAAPVARRPATARPAALLGALLAATLVLFGRPLRPAQPFAAADALVRAAGDLTLVPTAVQPLLGAAVLAALVAALAYGLRSRRGRLVALPLLGALALGPIGGHGGDGGAVALLPLFAVLGAGAARWGARRLARHVPTAVYGAVAALTAAVIGFLPLLGLGAHYGHLLRADRSAPPSPQVLEALARVGAPPRGHPVVLLDSRGYRAGVVGWVLALRGYRVRFVGDPYARPAGAADVGRSLARTLLSAAPPSQTAAFVITREDYLALGRSDPAQDVLARIRARAVGGYVVGEVLPTPPPPMVPGGGVTWAPGEGPAGTAPGAGPYQ